MDKQIVKDYVLIMGSIGLFIILALVMYTWKIDWYEIGLTERVGFNPGVKLPSHPRPPVDEIYLIYLKKGITLTIIM